MTLDSSHIQWTRATVNSLKVGGVWAVPRSGALVSRTGEAEVEIAVPPDAGADQVDDAILIARHCTAAGFEVTLTEELTQKAWSIHNTEAAHVR